MSKVDVVVVVSEDTNWVGLYVGGKLMDEGDGYDAEWMHHLVGHTIEKVSMRWMDEDWLDEIDTLPENLSDVKEMEVE